MTIQVFNPKIKVLPLRYEQPQAERCLCAGQVESLPGLRPGDAILCTRGVLWVTQAGDPDDYLLRAGEQFLASRPGAVLAQALDESACRYYLA